MSHYPRMRKLVCSCKHFKTDHRRVNKIIDGHVMPPYGNCMMNDCNCTEFKNKHYRLASGDFVSRDIIQHAPKPSMRDFVPFTLVICPNCGEKRIKLTIYSEPHEYKCLNCMEMVMIG